MVVSYVNINYVIFVCPVNTNMGLQALQAVKLMFLSVLAFGMTDDTFFCHPESRCRRIYRETQALNQDAVTLLQGKPPSLLPAALKSSAVGAVCVIKIAVSWMEHFYFLKKKKKNQKLIGC